MARQNKTETTTVSAGKLNNSGYVRYAYIPKRIPGVTNKNHVLYDGKLPDSIDTFTVLRNDTGRYSLDLNEAEKNFLIEELQLEPNDLNVNDRNNEYLKNIKIDMPKAGLSLDLSDPYDFLRDKVLTSYNNIIAPNSKSIKNKKSYRYVRLHEEEETVEYLEAEDTLKEAYKMLGILETNRDRMIMTVLMDKVRISPIVSDADLRKMVNIKAKDNPAAFVKMLNDPLFTEKGMIKMGLFTKTIERRSGLLYYQGEPLSDEGTPATEDNAAIYLADARNSEVKVALGKDIKNDFKRV